MSGRNSSRRVSVEERIAARRAERERWHVKHPKEPTAPLAPALRRKLSVPRDLTTLVLALDRWQLRAAYTALTGRAAQWRYPRQYIDALLEHRKPADTRAACESQLDNAAAAERAALFRERCRAAKKPPPPEGVERRARAQAIRDENRLELRARIRLVEIVTKKRKAYSKGYGDAHRAEMNARKRAVYAAMTPEQKHAHIQAQEQRLRERLRDDPEKYAAHLARKKRNAASTYSDPAKAEARRQSRSQHTKKAWAAGTHWYQRLKTENPAKHEEIRAKQMRGSRARYLRRKLRSNPNYAKTLMADVMKMIPRSLHPELREDLRNDIVRDILAGELTFAKVPQVMKSYAAKARRMLNDRYKFVSLDDVIPGTDGVCRIDTIAADQPHF